jgi:hypothetical protein
MQMTRAQTRLAFAHFLTRMVTRLRLEAAREEYLARLCSPRTNPDGSVTPTLAPMSPLLRKGRADFQLEKKQLEQQGQGGDGAGLETLPHPRDVTFLTSLGEGAASPQEPPFVSRGMQADLDNDNDGDGGDGLQHIDLKALPVPGWRRGDVAIADPAYEERLERLCHFLHRVLPRKAHRQRVTGGQRPGDASLALRAVRLASEFHARYVRETESLQAEYSDLVARAARSRAHARRYGSALADHPGAPVGEDLAEAMELMGEPELEWLLVGEGGGADHSGGESRPGMGCLFGCRSTAIPVDHSGGRGDGGIRRSASPDRPRHRHHSPGQRSNQQKRQQRGQQRGQHPQHDSRLGSPTPQSPAANGAAAHVIGQTGLSPLFGLVELPPSPLDRIRFPRATPRRLGGEFSATSPTKTRGEEPPLIGRDTDDNDDKYGKGGGGQHNNQPPAQQQQQQQHQQQQPATNHGVRDSRPSRRPRPHHRVRGIRVDSKPVLGDIGEVPVQRARPRQTTARRAGEDRKTAAATLREGPVKSVRFDSSGPAGGEKPSRRKLAPPATVPRVPPEHHDEPPSQSRPASTGPPSSTAAAAAAAAAKSLRRRRRAADEPVRDTSYLFRLSDVPVVGSIQQRMRGEAPGLMPPTESGPGPLPAVPHPQMARAAHSLLLQRSRPPPFGVRQPQVAIAELVIAPGGTRPRRKRR